MTIHELNGEMFCKFNIIKSQDVKSSLMESKKKRRLLRNKSKTHDVKIEDLKSNLLTNSVVTIGNNYQIDQIIPEP